MWRSTGSGTRSTGMNAGALPSAPASARTAPPSRRRCARHAAGAPAAGLHPPSPRRRRGPLQPGIRPCRHAAGGGRQGQGRSAWLGCGLGTAGIPTTVTQHAPGPALTENPTSPLLARVLPPAHLGLLCRPSQMGSPAGRLGSHTSRASATSASSNPIGSGAGGRPCCPASAAGGRTACRPLWSSPNQQDTHCSAGVPAVCGCAASSGPLRSQGSGSRRCTAARLSEYTCLLGCIA